MTDCSERLPDWVKPGVSFRLVFGNSQDTLWHVRGIVDGMAVCRRWRSEKQRWAYEVQNETFFDVNRDHIQHHRR
jgi:hypothetical protein